MWGCTESRLWCQKPAAVPLPTLCLIWSLAPSYGLASEAVWPRKDFQKTCIHSQGARNVLNLGLVTVTYIVLVKFTSAALWQGTQLYRNPFQEPSTISASVLSYTFLQVCACLEGCHMHKSCLSIRKCTWGFVFQVEKELQVRSTKRCE